MPDFDTDPLSQLRCSTPEDKQHEGIILWSLRETATVQRVALVEETTAIDQKGAIRAFGSDNAISDGKHIACDGKHRLDG
jgi:hypothetical protein